MREPNSARVIRQTPRRNYPLAIFFFSLSLRLLYGTLQSSQLSRGLFLQKICDDNILAHPLRNVSQFFIFARYGEFSLNYTIYYLSSYLHHIYIKKRLYNRFMCVLLKKRYVTSSSHISYQYKTKQVFNYTNKIQNVLAFSLLRNWLANLRWSVGIWILTLRTLLRICFNDRIVQRSSWNAFVNRTIRDRTI